MRNKIYVIAGNYQQFILYRKATQNQVYVQDKFRLYGLVCDVMLAGTYYMRKDWSEIKELLIANQANIIIGEL